MGFFVCPPPRARIAPTAFGAVYCVETVGRAPKGSLYRRFLALADVVTCQSPQSPLPLAGERTAREHNKITLGHTEVLYEPPNEAQIRLRVSGRPACAEFCPSTHCCPPNSYNCTLRAH